MRFSKTKVLAALKCEKQLYLSVHHPELAEKSVSPASVTGQVVEEHAHREFPDAVIVERNMPNQDSFEFTGQLLQDDQVSTIFEAGIQCDELALFVDVLQRNGDGWDVIEIKAATQVKDEFIDDVAVQALALSRSGIEVKHYYLMHINNDFVYRGNRDYTDLFVREEITNQVLHHVPFIAQHLEQLNTIIAGEQPERHLGSYCKNPYLCSFYRYCESQDAEYPVAWLPSGWRAAQKLIAQGIYDIRDIPVDELSSETHQWVRNVTLSGEPELLSGAKHILDSLPYPRYYLDFECIQFAIPVWENTRPYVQLPFQWSCHIQKDRESLEHEAFLDTSGSDPRYQFAKSLLEVCGETGPIIVYNQSFEKRIIKELAETFPDLSNRLLALNERVFDLLPVAKKNYYHPDMKGSWSIKKILPCLVPELSYSDLANVQDGIQAQAVYLEIIQNDLSEAEKNALREDLLAYCQLDTYAMVAMVDRLQKG